MQHVRSTAIQGYGEALGGQVGDACDNDYRHRRLKVSKGAYVPTRLGLEERAPVKESPEQGLLLERERRSFTAERCRCCRYEYHREARLNEFIQGIDMAC